jgi:hypothetical protein
MFSASMVANYCEQLDLGASLPEDTHSWLLKCHASIKIRRLAHKNLSFNFGQAVFLFCLQMIW